MLGFLFALAWCVTQENSSRLRLASAFLLPLAVIGIIRDWRYPAYSDGHFPDYARQFDESAPCTIVTIPTYPVGWPVRLVTKGRNCAFGAEGYIDAPAEGAKISPQGFSSGWVINTAGTKQVFLYVDGSLAKTVNTAYPRPDVDKAFPGYPDTKKGWATLLDISKLKAGKHELVVRALDNQGREAQIGRREFSN
jgi:N-acetylmuramoyl-L-alanine amidase